MGGRAFWNFRRQGEVKMFMLCIVEYGYFLESPNFANCQQKSLKHFVMCLGVEKIISLLKLVLTVSTFHVIHVAG